jgi:hypothetical protein
MGTGVRLGRDVLKATHITIGATLLIGAAVGCGKAATTAASSSPAASSAAVEVTTASVPTSAGHSNRTVTPSASGTAPTATTSKSPATGASAVPTQPGQPTSSASSGPVPTQGQTTPAPTSTQPIAVGPGFSASCPDSASTSDPGCGSWDAGPSSGQAPGFAAGQRSSANMLGVNQDPWSGRQGPQSLTANSFEDWSVTATDKDPANAPGEVLTYPDASFNYYRLATASSGYKDGPPAYDLNNITSLTSSFSETMPRLSYLNAEAAYDLWLNNWQTEVMVWVDTSARKDRDLTVDGMSKAGTYTYMGQHFSLWHSGNGITGFYVFLLDHNETSGTVDLKAMLETMVSLGYIPANSSLTQIPFGWEISDTGGKPVTFTLSQFSVSLQN